MMFHLRGGDHRKFLLRLEGIRHFHPPSNRLPVCPAAHAVPDGDGDGPHPLGRSLPRRRGCRPGRPPLPLCPGALPRAEGPPIGRWMVGGGGAKSGSRLSEAGPTLSPSSLPHSRTPPRKPPYVDKGSIGGVLPSFGPTCRTCSPSPRGVIPKGPGSNFTATERDTVSVVSPPKHSDTHP